MRAVLTGVFATVMGMVAAIAPKPLLAEPLEYFLVDGVRYDTSVLRPEAVFGHDLGDQPVRYDLMVDYIRQLAAASPRMTVETIGYSHERRPILFITVSDPDNLSRIDDIRAAHLSSIDPSNTESADADRPVITWLNYGVHGAESSGMDAAIPTLYHLAAGEDAALEAQLKSSVILITAIFNPDGHSRRVNWVTSYKSDVVNRDPNHEIHNQVWPGGRTNHYWFDLNRQWLLQTQPESRAWLGQWHKWKPNVSGDFHEMGGNSTYYFHPGEPKRKFPLVPARGRELLVDIAGDIAESLDQARELYFTEEGFDNFYIGKGSTYPQLNGGLGILYEAGAQMGLERESEQGIKTLARNIRSHMKSGLATIKGAVRLRSELQAYQAAVLKGSVSDADRDRVKAYVFQAPEDPTRLAKFANLMARHDVRSYALNEEIRTGGRTYPVGSLVIPTRQMQYKFIKAAFDRFTDFEENIFYDVSGWTLPLAYGLDYAEVRERVRGKLGDAFPGADAPASAAVPDRAPYAYVMRWSDYYAPRALGRVLSHGVMARLALKPIRVKTTKGDVSFERGAIIVQLDRQTVDADTIYKIMAEAAAEDGVTVHAATSGRTVNAGADLGGRNSVRDLTMPNPLLIAGPGFSPYDAGEIWHQLDHRMKLPLTIVRKERLNRIDLHDYSHIILPGGRISFSERVRDRMKDFVREGGTLIAQRSAAIWAAKSIVGHEGTTEKSEPTEPPRLSYADKAAQDAEHVVGGTIFESSLDLTHPLAFGYVRRRIATHKNMAAVLPVPKDPYARVAVYTDTPKLSGYASERRENEIAGTPMLTAERLGQGSVILFADNPNFRATYLGAEKLFLNALFFSRTFSPSFAEDAEAGEAAHSHSHSDGHAHNE